MKRGRSAQSGGGFKTVLAKPWNDKFAHNNNNNKDELKKISYRAFPYITREIINFCFYN